MPPEAFERLCAELVDRESKQGGVHVYGRRGQKQYGIDIVEFAKEPQGESPAPAHVYQVKRFQVITPAELRNAVELYAASHRFKAEKFTVMTSAPTDDKRLIDELAELREQFKGQFEVQLEGPAHMQNRLRNHATTVRAVFGKAMAEALCGDPGEAPPALVRDISSPEPHIRTLKMAMEQDFHEDNAVRFNEADLVGPSVDAMFVDVPVVAHARTRAGQLLKGLALEGVQLDWNSRQEFAASLAPSHAPSQHATGTGTGTSGMIGPISMKAGQAGYEPMESAGGAQALLHPRWLESTVIVGGPGQGKSTLLQYICQTQRARHLGMHEYEHEDHQIQATAAMPRIPFRIDLRLYAKMRREALLKAAGHDPQARKGRRPKKKKLGQDINDPAWLKGLPAETRLKILLENYISEQVSIAAAGTEFTVDHLINVVSRWPVLFAFDGLDEVAPLTDRAAVSDVIRDFRNRYSSDGLDALVVVTTRPGVVERPIWNDPNFATLQLGDLVPALKMRYVEKWARSVDLPSARREQLVTTFEAEHYKPHVREVSSNPMQLAILCRLLERRTVIPDQRTALYDEYIGVFFDREFEKSDIIGQYRPTLAKIHAYLGWWMHTKAEGGNSNGTIDLATLRELLHEFLGGIGQPTDMVDELYNEMQARVICLVQRRQGSGVFEFEVQGIREYFAAQYLVKELSASSSGTKGKRLGEAIRRPYWWNTMRFAAGMFDDGELPDIVYVCRELQRAEFNRLPLPRQAAKQLLDDHIFRTVNLTVAEDLIRDVLSGTGIFLAVDGMLQPGSAPFTFPPGATAWALATVLKERILAGPRDECLAASTLLCRQLDLADADGVMRSEIWQWWWGDGDAPEVVRNTAPSDWLEVASTLRLLSDLRRDEEELLCSVIDRARPGAPIDVLELLARGGRWSPGSRLHELCVTDLAAGAADGYLPPAPTIADPRVANDDDRSREQLDKGDDLEGEDPEDETDDHGRLLISGQLGQLIRASQVDRCLVASKKLGEIAGTELPKRASSRRRIRGHDRDIRIKVAALDDAFDALLTQPDASGWATLLDVLEEEWGDSWLLRQIILLTLTASTQAAAARVTRNDANAPIHAWPDLVTWAASAKRNRNDADWWRSALTAAADEDAGHGAQSMFVLAAAVALLNGLPMSQLAPELNSLCSRLTHKQWGRVAASCARAAAEYSRPLRLGQQLRTTFKPSSRLAVLLLTRADDATASESIRFVFPDLNTLWQASPAVDSLVRRLVASAPRKVDLDQLRGSRGSLPADRFFNLPPMQNLTVAASERVLEQPAHWPADLVRAAAENAEARIAAKLPSMGDLAASRNWTVPGTTPS